MNKVLIYARVSTNHHHQNPEVQIYELRRYCESRGWKVFKEIIDHGFSGGIDQRPGLQEMLNCVRDGEVDCICVLKLDRLFRSLRQLVTALDDFAYSGIISIISPDAEQKVHERPNQDVSFGMLRRSEDFLMQWPQVLDCLSAS